MVMVRRRHDKPPFGHNGRVLSECSPASSSVRSKPSLADRRRRNGALFLGAILMFIVLSHLDDSSPDDPLPRRQPNQHLRFRHRRREGPPRHAPVRKQLSSPLVCSHQLLNPPPLPPDLPPRDGSAVPPRAPPDGSLDAMTSLWHNGGVTCFDVDVVVLSDGSLLASHPRRLTAAILDRKKNGNGSGDGSGGDVGETEIALEDFTLDSVRDALGMERRTGRAIDNGSGSHTNDDYGASPFPLFDSELLPHFARLVRGIPGAFSPTKSTRQMPWELVGPLLNVDLKQGPYLTEERVLKLAEQIHALGLEDYMAVCVTAPPPPSSLKDGENGAGVAASLDLLDVLHRHNTETAEKTIPLGLVLRDLVPEDADVDRVREVVEDLYPESIRALVPSFKFSNEWYRKIRGPGSSGSNSSSNSSSNKTEKDSSNELWRLPMTVWTIDSKEDYRFVSSITTAVATATTEANGSSDKIGKASPIPMASAAIANKPMDIVQLE